MMVGSRVIDVWTEEREMEGEEEEKGEGEGKGDGEGTIYLDGVRWGRFFGCLMGYIILYQLNQFLRMNPSLEQQSNPGCH